MNRPPSGIVFAWDGGIPSYVSPGEERPVQFQLQPVGAIEVASGSGELFVRSQGGSWTSVPVQDLGENTYQGNLPAVACAEAIEFYARGEAVDGTAFTDPGSAPASGYIAVGADGTETLFRLDFEEPATGWTIENDSSLTTGAWEQVDPLGTLFGTIPSQPEDDATNGADAVQCFITQNGTEGGSVGEADVDGGPTSLISPSIDIDGTDGTVSYARWFFDSESEDSLITEISNDGGASWTFVHESFGTNAAWETASFRVGDYVVPSAEVRVRFIANDGSSPSVVEAGIDNLQLDIYSCDDEPCLGDVDGSGAVNVDDVLIVLGFFGEASNGPADLDGDGVVSVNDVLIVIGGWGPCEP